MANNQKKDHENTGSVLIGVLFLLGGLFFILKNDEYHLQMFGFLELPLWLFGAASILMGIMMILINLDKKKKEKEENKDNQ